MYLQQFLLGEAWDLVTFSVGMMVVTGWAVMWAVVASLNDDQSWDEVEEFVTLRYLLFADESEVASF